MKKANSPSPFFAICPPPTPGCYWLIVPGKEEAMDEEILKWKRKHPEAVRASMANPANYWNPPNKGTLSGLFSGRDWQ